MILVIVEHFLSDEGKKIFPEWLKKADSILQSFAGYQSIGKLEQLDYPDSCLLLLRFDCIDNLKIWSGSEEHNKLLSELLPYRFEKHQSRIYIE